MECKNCGYFWQEEHEERPTCHWQERCPGDIAPCEEDDYLEPEDDPELEDWELAGYWSEAEYIEDIKAQEWVDAWKNGDFDY